MRSDDQMGIEIRRIRSDEAETLKQTRLALLADSPAAFGSTLERELAFTDETWAARAAGSSAGSNRATYLALEADQVVGIVGAGRAPGGADSVVELESMWTAPAMRRSGLGRSLVDNVLDWAASTGSDSVELWVAQGNDAAQQLYESMGFAVTGHSKPLPSNPCKDEVRMSRSLTAR